MYQILVDTEQCKGGLVGVCVFGGECRRWSTSLIKYVYTGHHVYTDSLGLLKVTYNYTSLVNGKNAWNCEQRHACLKAMR